MTLDDAVRVMDAVSEQVSNLVLTKPDAAVQGWEGDDGRDLSSAFHARLWMIQRVIHRAFHSGDNYTDVIATM